MAHIKVNYIIRQRIYGKWETSLRKVVEVELPIFLFIKIIKATSILVWVSKYINNKSESVALDKEKKEADLISTRLPTSNPEANIRTDHTARAEIQHRQFHPF